MCKHLTLFPVADEIGLQPAIAAALAESLRKSSVSGGNTDGTGIGYINNNGRFVVNKSGRTAYGHTLRQDFVDMMLGIDLAAQPVIGHVRSASLKFKDTKDKQTGLFPDKDAHPFAVGDILLAHNGTISNHKELVEELGLSKGNIDSYMIAELMARLPDLELDNLNGVTRQFEGSFALVFQHLSQPNRLYICRHKKPLYLVKVYSARPNQESPNRIPDFMFVATNDDNAKDALRGVVHISRYLAGRRIWSRVEAVRLKEDTWYVLDRDTVRETGEPTELGRLEFAPTKTVVYTAGSGVPANGRAWGGSGTHGVVVEAHAKAGRNIANVVKELLVKLPLTTEEFRYLYTSLNQLEPDVAMAFHHAVDTVDYVLYLLEDSERRKFLGQFLDMDIEEAEDDRTQFVLIRHPAPETTIAELKDTIEAITLDI